MNIVMRWRLEALLTLVGLKLSWAGDHEKLEGSTLRAGDGSDGAGEGGCNERRGAKDGNDVRGGRHDENFGLVEELVY